MQLLEFLDKLKLAHDVPNYYNNHFPYNCGYYDGSRFSFDCWNLIKAILGGWTDNRTKGYYVSPSQFPCGDCDGYHLLMQCTDRSKDFSKLKQPGTYLYLSTSPHAGVYVGDFEYQGEIFNVVECTGAWASKVQYTYVDEKGGRYLYKGGDKNKYSWTDYGLLPWVDYNTSPQPMPTPNTDTVVDSPYGIDVSRYQKGFDLNSAIAQGFAYCIAKCGGADAGYYKDSQFDNFYQQAVKDGMKIGAYYFGCAFSVEDAVTEASNCLNYLQGKNIKHIYYDVEGKMLNQGYTHLTDIIKAFCQTMVNEGYICGVYTSESQFNSRFDDKQLSAFPHWVAKYSKNAPALKSGNAIEAWQYGGSTNYIRDAKINGTIVDQDVFFIPWTDTPIPKDSVCVPLQGRKSVDQVAVEVLAGMWGNGIIRQAKLIADGYDVATVQARVNEIIEQRKQTKKTHVVIKDETLSSIAKRYNTTVDALVKANNIPNKNRIYIGQELIIA